MRAAPGGRQTGRFGHLYGTSTGAEPAAVHGGAHRVQVGFPGQVVIKVLQASSSRHQPDCGFGHGDGTESAHPAFGECDLRAQPCRTGSCQRIQRGHVRDAEQLAGGIKGGRVVFRLGGGQRPPAPRRRIRGEFGRALQERGSS